jgi:hypothetical protein
MRPAVVSGAGGHSISPARERLDSILGKWRHHGGPTGTVDYKALWHEHLEEKYLAKQ